MVNPYVTRQGFSVSKQQQARQTQQTQISLGQSQTLKKVENIQKRHEKQQLKKEKKLEKASMKKTAKSVLDTSSSEESDNESSETTDSILKKTKTTANKFLKKPTPAARKSKDSSDEDDDNYEERQNEEEKDITIEEKFHYSDASNQNIVTIPSSSRVATPPSQKKNRVKFETKSPRRNKSKSENSEITEISTTNIEHDDNDTATEVEGINRNIIFDIDDLDAAGSYTKDASNSDKKSKNKDKKGKGKKTNSKKSKSPRNLNSQKNKKSEEKKSFNTSDDDDIETVSIVGKNLILDIDQLENAIEENKMNKKEMINEKSKPPKHDVPKLRSALSKKSIQKRHSGSRSHSIVSQESDSIVTEIITEHTESEDSIASEIQTVNESSHRIASASKSRQPTSTSAVPSSYQDDFDTESDASKVFSKANAKSAASSMSAKPKHKERLYEKPAVEKRSIEIQVDQIDLMSRQDLVDNLKALSPYSVVSRQTNVQDLTSFINLNTIGFAFNDLMKMNLQFMKSFIQLQRQTYENELKSIQEEHLSKL